MAAREVTMDTMSSNQEVGIEVTLHWSDCLCHDSAGCSSPKGLIWYLFTGHFTDSHHVNFNTHQRYEWNAVTDVYIDFTECLCYPLNIPTPC